MLTAAFIYFMGIIGKKCKFIPPVAARAITAVPFLSATYIAKILKLAYPELPRLVWKNLVTEPGFVNFTESYDNIATVPNDLPLIYAGFDTTQRQVCINNYYINTPNGRRECIDEYKPLYKIHEIGHARSAHYTESLFFGKNKYRIAVSDEIARRIDEIIGFTRIPKIEKIEMIQGDASYDWLKNAHREIIKLSHFKNLKSIYSDNYAKIFSDKYLVDPMILDIILESATKGFHKDFDGGYKEHIKEFHTIGKLLASVDFYNTPVFYKTAMRKIFEFQDHNTSAHKNIMDCVSPRVSQRFHSNLERMVNQIVKSK